LFFIVAETLLSDDECDDNELQSTPKSGPFSALTASMWPHDFAAELSPVRRISTACNKLDFNDVA